MSIIGGNVNIRLSSSTESLKGPELKVETPTSGTKRRKGKKPVEAPPTEDIRQALAKMVVIDELSFSFVECEGFRMFRKIVIPDFVPPSCATITRDCYVLFIEKGRH
ncbi:hypothetical protein V6N13_048246 [Hibiscus sabdariffa]